jgi:hypothetical protein
MKRTSLLVAFAVAASAGLAEAQAHRVNWDAPDMGTPSVRELIQSQPAPKSPKSAPAAPAAAAAAAKSAANCPDAAELAGRAIRLTLNIEGADKPLVFDLAYDACHIEYPRDEPPVPPFTYRSYKTSHGDTLGLYSSSDRPTTNVSFHLADGSSSATLLPIYANADLASGRDLDLGSVLLVKTQPGRDGVVINASGSIKSVPSR